MTDTFLIRFLQPAGVLPNPSKRHISQGFIEI